MITINKSENTFIMKIFAPRQENDEVVFAKFLSDLLNEKKFNLLISVNGEKNFTHGSKVALNIWYKENKQFLYENCLALYRVRDPETYDGDKIKRFKKAFPFHYDEFSDFDKALSSLKSLS